MNGIFLQQWILSGFICSGTRFSLALDTNVFIQKIEPPFV